MLIETILVFKLLVSNALNHKQGGSGSAAAQLQLLPATNRQRRQTRQLLPPQHLSTSPTPTRATLTGYPLGVHHAPTAHGTDGKGNHNAGLQSEFGSQDHPNSTTITPTQAPTNTAVVVTVSAAIHKLGPQT